VARDLFLREHGDSRVPRHLYGRRYLELAASRSLPSDADIEHLCDLTEPRRDPWVHAELIPA
jgi:hypothetical protein